MAQLGFDAGGVDLGVLDSVFGLASLGTFETAALGGTFDPGTAAGAGDFGANFQTQQFVIVSTVPEPSSIVLLSMGLGALGLARLRRRRNKVAA